MPQVQHLSASTIFTQTESSNSVAEERAAIKPPPGCLNNTHRTQSKSSIPQHTCFDGEVTRFMPDMSSTKLQQIYSSQTGRHMLVICGDRSTEEAHAI